MKYFSYIFILIVSIFFFSCKPREVNMDEPRVAFQQIKDWYYKEKSYEEAIMKFNEFKSRYPYHKDSVQAELLIAESYYAQEKWPEASVSYEEFIKMHPRSDKIPYILYRNALCYYHQRNTANNRDQAATKESIREFKRYLKQFPKGKYAKEVSQNIEQSNQLLAEHEHFIADFYLRKELYHSALYRISLILKKYPEKNFLHEKALYNAAECYLNLASQKKVDQDNDKNIYIATYSIEDLRSKGLEMVNRYKNTYPSGNFSSKVQQLLNNFNNI